MSDLGEFLVFFFTQTSLPFSEKELARIEQLEVKALI